MSDNINYTGVMPGTKGFGLKSLTPDEKKICIDRVEAILDNLDDIQCFIGLKEYVKQISHWQGVKSTIEKEF